MKAGDLVMWKYNGKLNPKKVGIIVSDYYDKGIRDEPYKNVYWTEQQWVRPINPIHLEVISESR